MPAGRTSLDASDLIASGISDVLAPLYDEFDLIIIDAPSVLGCPESQQMSSLADSVVLVVKARSTTDKELFGAVATLLHAQANIIGLVMNQVKRSDRAAYGYYPSRYADYARR
jgi:Mrp family chromosome partitioning ATPase